MGKEMTVFETIYREYKEKVFGFLLHKTGNYTVSEDLCSDVFLKIAENIEKYDPQKSAVSTWVYSITRNTLYDYFRTHHESTELDESLSSSDNFVEEICNERMLEKLADALVALPEREREITVRRYYNGETLKEIGERLGISYAYVRVLHQAALGKLKDILENV